MAAASTRQPTSVRTGPWFDVPPTVRHEDPYRPGETNIESDESYQGPIMLRLKMLQVLYDMGYDEVAREKVSERFSSNMIYSYSPAKTWRSMSEPLRAGTEAEIKDAVQDTIVGERGMLDKEVLWEMSLELNSNEPVVLIGLGKMHYRTINDMQLIREEILRVFRENGIRPVRVYVRCGEYVRHENQFQITLLNVVNADIGGPSMIQLLDAAFHEEEWRKDLMSKEAWNGTDLLWRDESGWRKPNEPEKWTCSTRPRKGGFLRDVSPATKARVGSQRLLNAVFHDPESRSPSPELAPHEENARGNSMEQESFTIVQDVVEDHIIEPVEEPAHISPSETAAHEEGTSDPSKEEQVDKMVLDEVEDGPSEHPEMTALRENEAQRPGIQHPTWKHKDESESLFDLIRKQSSTVPDVDQSDDIGDSAATREDIEPSEGQSQTRSEDGFVVV